MAITRNSETQQEDVEYVGGLIKRISNFQPQDFVENIEERKRFQKTVYLIQAFGIKLGFKFNWYIHGPYCPPLADVGYSLAEQYEQVSERRFADPQYEERFAEFTNFIEPYKEDTESLEISASLHYLWDRNQDKPKDMLIEWMLNEKDLNAGFSECEEIWERLDRFYAITN